jgi:hypothetical protein
MIGFIDTSLQFKINYYSSHSILTAETSLYSASRSTTDYKRLSLSPISLRHGPRTENTLRTRYPSNSLSVIEVFMLPLHRNDHCSIVACVFIAARMCLAIRCLIVDIHVIIYCEFEITQNETNETDKTSVCGTRTFIFLFMTKFLSDQPLYCHL